MGRIEYVIACQRRSGSMFLSNLLREALSLNPQDFSLNFQVLKTSRGENIYHAWQTRSLKHFISTNDVRYLKIEDPGWDSFADDIRKMYPEARWITSIRPIEDIVTSHHNIRSWGEHDIGTLIYQWKVSLKFLTMLHRDSPGNLLVVDLYDAAYVSASQIARFLRLPTSPGLIRVVESWTPVNTLKFQQQTWGEEIRPKAVPEAVQKLRQLFPEIEDCERSYRKLGDECRMISDANG